VRVGTFRHSRVSDQKDLTASGEMTASGVLEKYASIGEVTTCGFIAIDETGQPDPVVRKPHRLPVHAVAGDSERTRAVTSAHDHTVPAQQSGGNNMALRPPIDVTARVSSDLSATIDAIVNDPDREPAVTLGDVLRVLGKRGGRTPLSGDLLHPQDQKSVIVELNELIDEYGPDARAIDFVAAQASEALSRVIEAAMGDASLPDEPTLGLVRNAVVDGLAATLIGEGALDADEDATILAELDQLIQRSGEDALASQFVRFE
jgi:hypothetical protein